MDMLLAVLQSHKSYVGAAGLVLLAVYYSWSGQQDLAAGALTLAVSIAGLRHETAPVPAPVAPVLEPPSNKPA